MTENGVRRLYQESRLESFLNVDDLFAELRDAGYPALEERLIFGGTVPGDRRTGLRRALRGSAARPGARKKPGLRLLRGGASRIVSAVPKLERFAEPGAAYNLRSVVTFTLLWRWEPRWDGRAVNGTGL